VQKTRISICWLFLVVCPSLIGFLFLEAISPKATVFRSGSCLRRDASNYVCRVVASPDGKTCASAELNGTITLWEVASRRRKAILRGHDQFVWQIVYSPDGSTIASASSDRTIRLWDVAGGGEKRTLRGHQDHVCCVVFTPDGKTIVSASSDKTIRLWDVDSGENVATFSTDYAQFSLALSPDGATLASANIKTLKLWDIANRKERATLSESSWSHVVFSPDGKTLASVGERPNESLSLWDVETGEQRSFDPPLKLHDGGIGCERNCLQFTPDGKRLILCGRNANVIVDDGESDYVSLTRIEVWDVATGKKSNAFGPGPHQIFPPSRHLLYWLRDSDQPIVESIQFTPDGKLVTLESNDHEIGMREIDFNLVWYYRFISFLVTVSSLAIAACAFCYWRRSGLRWYYLCILSLTAFTALSLISLYMVLFWVEAWGENTMPASIYLLVTHVLKCPPILDLNFFIMS
jgi:WD40 repeat protein